MRNSRMHLASAACIALVACTSTSACGGAVGGPRANDWVADAEARIQLLTHLGGGERSGPPRAATASSTATVRVALTGLILMMPPPAGQVGPTQLFMPNIAGHDAYVAFRKTDPSGCDEHNPHFDVCFMSLDRSRLAPLGTVATAPEPHKIPTGVVNLSHGSGHKADTAGINGRIRARATLMSGKATDSCALASWSWDPAGQSVEFPSVLTWELDAPEGDSIVLLRQPLNGTSPVPQRFVVHAIGGRIDLLILHLTRNEFRLVEAATRGLGPEAPPVLNAAAARLELQHHFTMAYNMINTPATPRPLPRDPISTHRSCPLPVLGMENAVYESSQLPLRERVMIDGIFAPKVGGGVRTFSCVMALAEGD